MSTPKTILFDADGVLQRTPDDWIERVRALCPDPARRDAFQQAVFARERPVLRGVGVFEPALAEVLVEFESTASPEVALQMWRELELDEAVLDVAGSLARSGHRVVVASNQQDVRAAYVRSLLGERDLFDAFLFSCDLGACKPDRAFFEGCVRELSVQPADCLFIDDSERNAESARASGMTAFWFQGDVATLRSWLRCTVGLPG